MRRYLYFGVIFVFVASVGGAGFIIFAPKSLRTTPVAPEIKGNIEKAPMQTSNAVAPAKSSQATPTPPPDDKLQEIKNSTAQRIDVVSSPKYGEMLNVATNVQAEPTPTPDMGFYRPLGAMVKCKLINTVDSSTGATVHVDGRVDEDVWFRNHCFIRKGSEVHGTAQIDKSRERIDAECVWVFVLADECGHLTTKELTIEGQAEDMANDPEFEALCARGKMVTAITDKWGITDASSGLRGVVIQTDNMAAINLWVSAFASALTQSISTVGQNFGSIGGVATPAATNVLNGYAQQVLKSIETDGFFIRVPSAKRFYVRIAKGFWTSDERVAASTGLKGAQESFMSDREQNEQLTEPRRWRDDRKKAPQLPIAQPDFTQRLNDKMDAVSARLEKKSNQLSDESNQLATPSPTP